MFRPLPFNLKENAEKGQEMVAKALETVMEHSFNPLDKVGGMLFPFRVDVIDGDERDRLTGYEAPEALAGAQHRQGQRRVAHECLLWLRVVEQNTMGHRRLPYGGRVSGYSGGVLRRPPAREKIGGDVMRSFGGPPHSRSRR